jgi:hypothetical protein
VNTNLAALLVALSNVVADPAELAFVVTRGDISGAMNLNPLGDGKTLAVQLKALGAGDAVRSLGATDALIVVGYAGLGEGNASFVLSNTGQASATVLIVDGSIVGPRTERVGAGSLSGANMSLPLSVGALYVSSSSVGVGTTSPSTALDVSGDVRASGSVSSGSATFGSATVSGNLTVIGSISGNLAGNVTGNVTGNVSGSAGSVLGSNVSGYVAGASYATTAGIANDIANGAVTNAKLGIQLEDLSLQCCAENTTYTTSARTLCTLYFAYYAGSGLCETKPTNDGTGRWYLHARNATCGIFCFLQDCTERPRYAARPLSGAFRWQRAG